MGVSAWPAKKIIRQYVRVRVDFDELGGMYPRSILWIDDREYTIDRVKDMRSAPALKGSGQGDRYTVEIGGQDRYLFFEHSADCSSERPGRWFVEVKCSEKV